MALVTGTRLGPYEIVSAIGAGGMGEVYRARDTKLGRDVAIKVLPDLFANDPERLARFQREAQLLASLNHPNIGGIYGLEEADGIRALVLELVEGPTLADVIAGHQSPEAESLRSRPRDSEAAARRGDGAPRGLEMNDALAIARQIAEALEAAHEQEIIHRDLKPANIKITARGAPRSRAEDRRLERRLSAADVADGLVKVLDFGLAKTLDDGAGAAGRAGGQLGLTQSPTMTTPAATRMGVILGTVAYMSPEQARGKTVDKRTDIWAFGCVLFEMLTGRRPFDGESISDVLASVLKTEPNWQSVPAETPIELRRLLRRCLEKDPRRRLQAIGEARVQIEDLLGGALDGTTTTAASQQIALPRTRERLAWMTTALVSLAVAAGALVWVFRPTPSAPEMRVEISTPPTTDPVSLAISPDGRKLAFVAASEGRPQLWLRSLDSTSARPLPGTVNARLPFWSQDSRSVGFFSDGVLKRIDIDGRSAQALTSAPNPFGGAWGRDDVILFNTVATGPIMRVSATGGASTGLTRVEPQQVGHRSPQFLPDGRKFLYYVAGSPEVRGVYLGEVDGSATQRLLDADATPVYAAGHLLYVRQNTLFAQSFDPARLTLTGTPEPVAEQVAVFNLSAALSASPAGVIVFRTGSAGSQQRQLVWVGRSGQEMEKVGAPMTSSNNPSLSPDGRRIGLQRTVNGNTDVWLLDTARGALTRITSDVGFDTSPIWSPDGSRIAFQSYKKGTGDLYQMSIIDPRNQELLVSTPQPKMPEDWSSNGEFLLYRSIDPNRQIDIWALSLKGDRKPFPVVQTNFDERDAQFSPDGHWIAYASNESGAFEIYLQPFPGPGKKLAVSTTGGAQIRWRHDGKELFYIALDGRLMAVPLRFPANSQEVEVGSTVPLFVTHIGGAVQNISRQQYVVSSDGQRFLMNTLTEEASASPITVILNWKPRN